MWIARSTCAACCAAVLAFATVTANGQITLQNDSGAGNVTCPCFVTGEEAAAWLTSPCSGTIIAVQIGWGSQFGGQSDSLEQAIHIYESGSFPNPGTEITVGNLALEGPVLVDGFINEFDISQLPTPITISTGETIVVSLEFFNSNSGQLFAPSVVHDGNGCQAGKNTVFAIPDGWVNICTFQGGITGDWLIRAVVDCGPTGACCNGETCTVTTQGLCENGGGVYQNDGTDCLVNPCLEPTGACCPMSGPCMAGLTQSECDAQSGTYQGDGVACSPDPCVEPTGACCFEGGGCLVLTQAQCSAGMYAGDDTDCIGDACTPGVCCLPPFGCFDDLIEAECNAQGGAFQGAGTVCDPFTCPATGACCTDIVPGQDCVDGQSEFDCDSIAGSWGGAASICEDLNMNGTSDVCEAPCAGPTGDINGDTFIDGRDASAFVRAVLGSPTPEEVCAGDFDGQNGLDFGDVTGLVTALLQG